MTIRDAQADADQAETFRPEAERFLADLQQAQAEQPARLAAARQHTQEARTKALAEGESWADQLRAFPTYDAPSGELTGMISMPSIYLKEAYGARLAFEILDVGDDEGRVDDVLNRFFTMLDGNAEHLLLVFSAALITISTQIVPSLLETVEQRASDYGTRVAIAEAAAGLWGKRTDDLITEFQAQGDPAADSDDWTPDRPW
jgi:hypothetical protein